VPEQDNSHAGQGAVVLDIGGDVGALVVRMPASLAGVEIEARPAGVGSSAPCPSNHTHGRPHCHTGPWAGPEPDPLQGGGHGHGRGQRAGAGRGRGSGHLEHVAVLARPLPDGRQEHCAVFAALPAGTYELYVRPAGPVRLSVRVTGGGVADATWP
jgi:hypothetical protein